MYLFIFSVLRETVIFFFVNKNYNSLDFFWESNDILVSSLFTKLCASHLSTGRCQQTHVYSTPSLTVFQTFGQVAWKTDSHRRTLPRTSKKQEHGPNIYLVSSRCRLTIFGYGTISRYTVRVSTNMAENLNKHMEWLVCRLTLEPLFIPISFFSNKGTKSKDKDVIMLSI